MSLAGLRVAYPWAMAKRNTCPVVSRARLAMSRAPRCSMVLVMATSSGASIKAMGPRAQAGKNIGVDAALHIVHMAGTLTILPVCQPQAGNALERILRC